MKYSGRAFGADTELEIGREGLKIGGRFLDFAEVLALRPINHRVFIDTISGQTIEISMLGFSFDGFWEELTGCFGRRSLEALFVDEAQIMLCEGEYDLPAEPDMSAFGTAAAGRAEADRGADSSIGDATTAIAPMAGRSLPSERGRGLIALFPDAVCILPQTHRAVRIPLCYTDEITLDGYWLKLTTHTGRSFAVGKMGYDTKPFAERTAKAADSVKKLRSAAIPGLPLQAPFTAKGLFRTKHPELYWNAAFSRSGSACAVELFTGDDAATYLYKFRENREIFLAQLEEAMEAVGVHREIINLADGQLAQKALYRMSVDRTPAVRFLRARAAGRLIHSAGHLTRLNDFLES